MLKLYDGFLGRCIILKITNLDRIKIHIRKRTIKISLLINILYLCIIIMISSFYFVKKKKKKKNTYKEKLLKMVF